MEFLIVIAFLIVAALASLWAGFSRYPSTGTVTGFYAVERGNLIWTDDTPETSEK